MKEETVATTFTPDRSFFKIIPVQLRNNNKIIRTFAFIDEGSSVSLIDKNLAKKLNLQGRQETLTIKWTGDTKKTDQKSQKVNFWISGLNEEDEFKLDNVCTFDDLNLPIQSVNGKELQAKYKHIRTIPLPSYEEAQPTLLLGLKDAYLGLPLEIKEGAQNEPIAIKTKLGWTVFGGQGKAENRSLCIEKIKNKTTHTDDELHNLVKNYFETESFGIVPAKPVLSLEDLRALDIMEKTTRRIGERFESGLLWSQDKIDFPDNRKSCENRAENLKRKLQRDPQLMLRVDALLQHYQSQKFIEEAEMGSDTRKW